MLPALLASVLALPHFLPDTRNPIVAPETLQSDANIAMRREYGSAEKNLVPRVRVCGTSVSILQISGILRVKAIERLMLARFHATL